MLSADKTEPKPAHKRERGREEGDRREGRGKRERD
jgi:hypothetical protein